MTYTYGSISFPNDDGSKRESESRERGRPPSLLRVVGVVVAYYVVILALYRFGDGTPAESPTLRHEQSKSILEFLGIRAETNNHSTETMVKGAKNDIEIADIPFPHVDRTEFGSTPVQDIVDPDLFDESLRPPQSSSSKGLLNVPFPTGAFWTNLVLKKATSDQGLSYPVMAYPYGYKWSPGILQISYPPLRRLMDEISIRDIFNPDMSFSSVEPVKSRNVMDFDPLSVTLRFSAAVNTKDDKNGVGKYWEAYLVHGSPYVTVAYNRVTPVLTALSIFTSFTCLEEQTGSCVEESESGDSSQQVISLRGTHFKIRTQENLTWILMASEPILLNYDNIRKTTISAANEFSGVLRLVLLPPTYEVKPELTSQFPTSYPTVESKSAIERLVCHANIYPVGGKIDWYLGKKNAASVHFKFETRTMAKRVGAGMSCPSNSNELLMLGLPHHLQVLPSKSVLNSQHFDVTFRSIKGTMAPVVGNEWSYEEALTTVGFDSDETLRNAASLEDNTKNRILDQVFNDMSRVLPTLDENVYGFGKQIARLAQLAHISDVLETKKGGDSLTVSITEVLHRFLSSFLSGKNLDNLLYDVNFGGIVSNNGLLDSMDDFGNGWYNDHLFHYGYILYASAVLGKLNSTFVAEYGSAVDALSSDVVNFAELPPTNRYHTNSFPFTRHKSWYDGHSFASGLFPFADGKSMESSGESVNCYYGAYLWSTIRWKNQPEHVDFARLLLAMEIRSVKTYWHMVTPDEELDTFHVADIYNPLFAKNLMVGNVGMMDVTVATWFGIEPLYVHMINYLPVTAITKELFEKSYVTEEFQNIIEPVYEGVEMAWKGYVVCDKAIVNPTGAWSDALDLRSYELDQAISQSQVLYFASTMDGFEDPGPSTGEAEDELQDSAPGIDMSATCVKNKACAELGLTGLCCPSLAGLFLGCCDNFSSSTVQKKSDSDAIPAVTETSSQTEAATTSNSVVSCANHKACADLGLLGLCCPAPNGQNLSCCST